MRRWQGSILSIKGGHCGEDCTTSYVTLFISNLLDANKANSHTDTKSKVPHECVRIIYTYSQRKLIRMHTIRLHNGCDLRANYAPFTT